MFQSSARKKNGLTTHRTAYDVSQWEKDIIKETKVYQTRKPRKVSRTSRSSSVDAADYVVNAMLDNNETSIDFDYSYYHIDHMDLLKSLVEDERISEEDVAEHGVEHDVGKDENILTRLDAIDRKLESLELLLQKYFLEHCDGSALPVDLIDPNNMRFYTPFFIRPEYAGRDNRTRLESNNFFMHVEILGHYKGTPVIYPFGFATNLPRFKEFATMLKVVEQDSTQAKYLCGLFRRRSNGTYCIEIADPSLEQINLLVLPIALECKEVLSPEM